MSHAESEADRPTVLVVDDDKATADLYATHLEERYTVRTAYSGPAALETVDAEVDVVLLDRRMSPLSGDAVLEELRERGLDCRVVMVTAVDPALDIVTLPFDEYLVKPVATPLLHDAVERMLARTQHAATLQEYVTLVSRMATLEAKLDIDDLHASDEYAALEARFVALQEELDAELPADGLYTAFVEEKLRALVS